MSHALCLLREAPHYRRDAFMRGLREAGFDLAGRGHKPRPGDVVVIWNRYAHYETEAQRFEAAGAAVIVAENGFIGHHADDFAKPYTADGEQLYALSLWQHNGAGQWWCGEAGRWRKHGIEVRKWREHGDHVLVLGQRGFGPPGIAMPKDWPAKAVERLKTMTKRPVRLRAHPGNNPAVVPLERDLEGCWAAVTWGSGAALKAICAGVPVFSDWQRWIGSTAASSIAAGMEKPLMCDASRAAMLDRLAWAQHTTGEIATGEPFRRLMSVAESKRAA